MREARSHRLLLLIGLAALAAAAWLVVGPEPPNSVNLALFLILLVPGIAGLLTPALAWLHRRVPLGRSGGGAAVRQAALIGLGVALAGWLQLRRLLDGTLLVGIAALILLIELLAQSRAS